MSLPKNKTIWFPWFQGLENAPELVKICYQSWKHHNPSYNVQIVSEQMLMELLPKENTILPLWNLPKVKDHYVTKADMVRVELLNRYGGIWVDATCLSTAPLESWLKNYFDGELFAFSLPAKTKRPIASWFLCANKDSYLINALLNQCAEYWSTPKTRFKVRGIERALSLHPKIWQSTILKSFMKKFPYFWLHYIFSQMLEEDAVANAIWQKSKKFSAENAHALQNLGLDEFTCSHRMIIENPISPVYKLTNRGYNDQAISQIIHSAKKSVLPKIT